MKYNGSFIRYLIDFEVVRYKTMLMYQWTARLFGNPTSFVMNRLLMIVCVHTKRMEETNKKRYLHRFDMKLCVFATQHVEERRISSQHLFSMWVIILHVVVLLIADVCCCFRMYLMNPRYFKQFIMIIRFGWIFG